jgi:hypothetical protein
MNHTIGNHDLITAENIMRYLQARRDELEQEYMEEYSSSSNVGRHYTKGRLHEVCEMLVHVEGDLDSTLKELI